jgi:signal transduction histidine kinase
MKQPHGDHLRASRAAEEWRFNLARQLHQSAQQQLVNIVMSLRRADQMWAERPNESRQLIELAAGEAQRALDELRDLVAEVYPTILASRGLVPALRWLATRLRFPLDLDVPSNVVPSSLEPAVYFLCYQALTEVPGQEHVLAATLKVVANNDALTIEIHFEGDAVAAAHIHSWLAPLYDRLLPYEGYVELHAPADRNPVLTMQIPKN